MIITVECIHRANDLQGSITDYVVCDKDNMVSESNKITCHINSISSEAKYRLPICSILLNDVMSFSNKMVTGQQYDCVLEIASFNQVELFTNHRYSIRGRYWRNIPQRYLAEYYLYKERECIEIGTDVVLISIYNSTLTNKINEGEIIEVIANDGFNLICPNT